ncbi:MAG TPA: hypothetical protein VG537_07580 [Candidatus Kapabacteria bacterium]|jgi:hypothetical protein|nr:hypothetical protein [Candidatus Kapabacteria bacterium]
MKKSIYLSIAGRAAVVATVSLLFLQQALAQGSPYDLIGFGTPVRSGNPAIDAMGGDGVALGATRTISDLNPADWTWLGRARFDIALRYEYSNYQLGTDQGAGHNINFSGITFGAPFWSDYNATVALGYVPLTNSDAEVDQTDSSGARTYLSKGGTNMLFLGVGARPVKGIALAARVDIVNGNVRHEDFLSIQDSTGQSGQFERDYFYYGVRPTFGFEFIGDSAGVPGLTIGASYSFGTSLTSTSEEIVTTLNSALDTVLDESGSGHYPSSFSAGLAYQFSHRYRGEVDYNTQDFSSAYVYSPNALSGDPNLRNSTRVGIGIERIENVAGEYGTSYGFDRWALRLGFYFSELPLNPVISSPGVSTRTGINELGFTAGVGIPVGFESMLNFSMAGGQRVPVVSGGAPKETFVRLGISVSMSERWFVPTRRD